MDLLSIFMGWLLGMLSPVVVSRISRKYNRNDLQAGILKEISHIRERLLGTIYLLSQKNGSLDKDLANWLLQRYKGLGNVDQRILDAFEVVSKSSSDEVLAYTEFARKQSESIGLTLKKFNLSFLNMHLMDISLFKKRFQVEIFELRSRIEVLNAEIDLAEKYFFMTFDSGLSQENLELIKNDLENKYKNIETMIKRVIDQIGRVEENAKSNK
jgi:hypothetical protein